MDITSDSDYFRHFNSRNAKLFGVGVIVVVSLYHTVLKLKYGEDMCVGLLETGRFQGDNIWQPYGCMLHSYSRSDSRMCMKYNHYWGRSNMIVYIGDGRIHQLFEDFVKELNPSYSSDGKTVDHLDPNSFSNGQFADAELNLTVEYFKHTKVDKSVVAKFQQFTQASRPNVVIVGAAMESIMEGNGSAQDIVDYAANISLLLPYIQQIKSTTRVLWLMQAPVDESKLDPNSTMTLNKRIPQYNDAAREILTDTSVRIWESARLLSAKFVYQSESNGFDLGTVAADYATKILLNFYCNDLMNYPDGTCCSHSEPMSTVQHFALFVLFGSIVFCAFISLSRCGRKYRHATVIRSAELNGTVRVLPVKNGPNGVFSYDACVSWAKFSAVLLFIFVCDRTSMYMKENKWFTYFNYCLPIVYLGILGIFFAEESKKTCFLNKDQTDEIRGWIQLLILVYNMTGASKVLWLTNINQLLISLLLFLLGYSHFVYWWSTGDFSLNRVFKVLLKYNLLAILLCVTMNRPYQFYEIVPLISYWFLVIYVTMALPPQVSSNSSDNSPIQFLYFIIKLILLFAVISILFLSEIFFEKVFITRPWKALFVMSDDSIQGWWSRWCAHRYSALGGVTFGFVIVLLRKYLILTDSQSSNVFSKRISILLAIVSTSAISIYIALMANCRNQASCTEIHAYVSVLPISAFLLLRNMCGSVRVRVSSLFMWFGRIWIELLITQYHLWLAADSHGVLVLFPRWPVFNVILTTFLFACLAHEIHSIIRKLLPILVPMEPQTILRNVAVLILLCIPLGVIYGMF